MAREEKTAAPRYIAINRNQQVLQPLDVDRLIDEDHAARKIWRVGEQLDLTRFESETLAVEGAAGQPSHAPAGAGFRLASRLLERPSFGARDRPPDGA